MDVQVEADVGASSPLVTVTLPFTAKVSTRGCWPTTCKAAARQMWVLCS
jgi:hypothetical protein